MTKEEFTKLFKIGDKVRLNFWKPGEYMKVLCVGDKKVFGENEHENEVCISLTHTWEAYKEPTPQWDWDAPFMWGKEINGAEVALLDKIGTVAYVRIYDKGECSNVMVTKTDMHIFFTPTTQPDNWKDYGLEEKDLK